MTDNGSCYRSKVFVQVCRQLGLKRITTRPQTNGKAERFMQSALHDWAYTTAFQPQSSAEISCVIGCIAATGIGLNADLAKKRLSADST